MKNCKTLAFFFLFFTLVILISAQGVGSTSYNTGKTFEELPRTDYMGTFSAIYYLKHDQKIEIDNELSAESASTNDSVIKSVVKKINHAANHVKDSASIVKLRSELLLIIDYANKKESIRGYVPDSVFQTIGKNTVTVIR